MNGVHCIFCYLVGAKMFLFKTEDLNLALKISGLL